MLKFQSISFILLLAMCNGYGQNIYNISGIIRSPSGEGLAKASVMLTCNSDSIGILSGSNGNFEFKVPIKLASNASQKFGLKVTMRGYKTFISTIETNSAKHDYILPPIVLQLEFQDLAPAIVFGVKPIVIRQDTVEYQTGAYKLRVGSELEQLMRRLPGVYLDTSGAITVEGRQVTKVMINGQDFVGGDIKAALEHIPVEIIDRVQIIDDFGAKAKLTGVKTGEPDKIMNLILKMDRQHGEIADVDVAPGDKSKYKAALFSQGFDGNRQLAVNGKVENSSPAGNSNEKVIELGYTDKWNTKWSSKVGVSFWGDNHSSANSMTQSNYYSGQTTSQVQQNIQTSGVKQNELLNCEQKYNPDDNTLLEVGISSGFYYGKEAIISKLISSTQIDGSNEMDTVSALNMSRSKTALIGATCLFERTNPRNKHKMMILVNFRQNNKTQDEDDSSQTKSWLDSLGSSSVGHYLVHTATLDRQLTAMGNYYIPLCKQNLLELGYDWNYTQTQNGLTTQIPDNVLNRSIIIDSLTNFYKYLTTSNSIHAGYLGHFANVNFNLRLDIQPSHQQSQIATKNIYQSYNYTPVLPQVQITYAFFRANSFDFDYSGASTPPTLQQLQPTPDLSDPSYPIQGNPYLKPSYTHSFSLNYKLSSLKATQYWGFTFGLASALTLNPIIPDVIIPKDTSSIIEKTTFANVNVSHSVSVHSRLDLPAFLNKRLRISTFFSLSEIQTEVLANEILSTTRSLTYTQDLQIRITIPDKIEQEFYFTYINTLSKYIGQTGQSYGSPGFNWAVNTRQEAWPKWVVSYSVSQVFTGLPGSRLQPNPVLINTSVQRKFFSRNQGKVTFSINNLLNSNSGFVQNVGPTSITQYRTNLVGRYFLLSIALQVEKFHNRRENIQGK